MPHPLGEIKVEFRVEDGQLRGEITLPDQVTGTLFANGQNYMLKSGMQDI
jgi:hypothetical protein